MQAQRGDFNKFYLEELTSWGASQTQEVEVQLIQQLLFQQPRYHTEKVTEQNASC